MESLERIAATVRRIAGSERRGDAAHPRRANLGGRRLMRLLLVLWCAIGAGAMGCDSGGDLADNGGMSGTGISQGSVTAFGSIFVNAVEWAVDTATIELDGAPATEADLRLGMVVRIEGQLDPTGLTGVATSVVFDDAVEGPIAAPPVETIPGVEKTFEVLGRTVVIDFDATVFDGGASFDGLAMDDVVEVSGFVDENDRIQATRVELKGQLATNDEVELRGRVASLMANTADTGIFDLGPIMVHYTAMTTFDGVSRATLADGDLVEVSGTLGANGAEIDAETIELEIEGLGGGDVARVEVEGIVALCPQSPEFCVDGIPVTTSGASFEPMGFTPMPGDRVEVDGSLVAGVLVADRVESENEADQENDEDEVRIDAGVASVDPVARTLVILGVTVEADGDTELEDESSVNDESFTFAEILPGDYVQVRGFATDVDVVQAVSIRRYDGTDGVDDVRLQGPVTFLDPMDPPVLSILGQPVPLDGATSYFDDGGNLQTEEAFFRSPGLVMLDDIVRATDRSATDLGELDLADEVELEGD
jgi:hypothetical protein